MRSRHALYALVSASLIAIATASAQTPTPPPAPTLQPFVAGTPLNMTGNNIRTFGSFRAAESVSYDAVRDLYVVVNTGVGNAVAQNDGYVSLLNPDGTVHTLKWIAPLATATATNGLTLNDPRGSFIHDGVLYIADQGIGSSAVRMFSMTDGTPMGEVTIEGTVLLNDLVVAADGTIYVTDSGVVGDPSAYRIFKIAPDRTVSVVATLDQRPNGIEFDHDGNLVVVFLTAPEVRTYTVEGALVRTEAMPETRMDGLIILDDGTKIVSSLNGVIMRIPAGGGTAEIIASGIPNAASIGYDPTRNRVIIPQNNENAVTFLDL